MALGEIGERHDPLLSHNFLITFLDSSSVLALASSVGFGSIGETAVGGFSECEGLEMTLEVEDYEEGGRNGEVLKFPKRTSWSNIILKRGIGLSNELWNWQYGFVEGRVERRDGMIALMDGRQLPNNVWYFKRGLPAKYTGPTFNASQNNVAIETLEIAHEGLFQVPNVGLGIAAVESLVNLVQ